MQPRSDRQWQAPFAVDVSGVLSVHRRGYGDPAFAAGQDGAIWRACRTPDGPGTLRVAWRTEGSADRDRPASVTVAHAQAWGPGAGWLLNAMPGLLGADDRPEEFVPAHPVLRAAARRLAAVRIGRSGLVLESLSWDWHRAGVEAVRARTIAAAARAASRLEEITHLPSHEADRRLQALPGIGVWTSAEVRQRACGDPDAVSVGDYHLPAVVGWALAGRPVDDAEMLELLAPYKGHRHRASVLAGLSGTERARRAPRIPVRDYRSI